MKNEFSPSQDFQKSYPTTGSSSWVYTNNKNKQNKAQKNIQQFKSRGEFFSTWYRIFIENLQLTSILTGKKWDFPSLGPRTRQRKTDKKQITYATIYSGI